MSSTESQNIVQENKSQIEQKEKDKTLNKTIIVSNLNPKVSF